MAKGPIVYALPECDFFVIFPIDPSTLARYREAFKTSRAKDDPTDAELALDLLMRHPERIKPLQPQGVAMRTLVSLTEHRRRFVNDEVRLTNRLTIPSSSTIPKPLTGSNSATPSCSETSSPLGDAASGQAGSAGEYEGILPCPQRTPSPSHCRRLAAIEAALPLRETPGSSCLLGSCHRADQRLRVALRSIDQFDRAIAELANAADCLLFRGLPGAGPHLAPWLLVAFGKIASASNRPMSYEGAPGSPRDGAQRKKS